MFCANRRVADAFIELYPCTSEPTFVNSAARLAALLDDLEARMRRGEVVYLHCWGGRGRAGTVGATLLHRLCVAFLPRKPRSSIT